MFLSATKTVEIFIQSIQDWHIESEIHQNPYPKESLEFLFYNKNHVDTIQWHEEDEIRRPDLPDQNLVKIKRNIDRLNQERTNMVEVIDDYIFNLYKDQKRNADAKMNSETPAWLIDRMSILELKIYHMEEQTKRTDASTEHITACKSKLEILLEQRIDMSTCLDQLLDDIKSGTRYFKVYRQMKMYNDTSLNPALYKKNS